MVDVPKHSTYRGGSHGEVILLGTEPKPSEPQKQEPKQKPSKGKPSEGGE